MIRGALELLAVVALLALFTVFMGCKQHTWLERYQEQMLELSPGTWTPAWDKKPESSDG